MHFCVLLHAEFCIVVPTRAASTLCSCCISEICCMYSHVVARPNIRNNEFMLLMHLQLERRVIFVIFSVAQCKGALLLVIDTNSSIHYSLHIHLSGLFKWHWSYIITIPVHFWICQRGHRVISFCNTVSVYIPRVLVHSQSLRLAKKDEACHLSVCAEGEMTFEHCAKCECGPHSYAAVRSDHCYFSCLSNEGFQWLSPFAALR